MSTVKANQVAYFNLFANSGEKAAELKFKKFTKGADGTTVAEDVVATYRVSNTDGNVSGSGLKDVTPNGNVIRKVNLAVKTGDTTVYFSGGLFDAKDKKNEKAPDFFGTAKKKGDEAEYQLSGWLKKTTKGDVYISCQLNEPYVADAGGASPAGGADMSGDIPF